MSAGGAVGIIDHSAAVLIGRIELLLLLLQRPPLLPLGPARLPPTCGRSEKRERVLCYVIIYPLLT